MGILEVLKKRHSVRKFKDKEVEKEKIQLILEAANSAPSAGNLQAREIFLIKHKQKKQKLVETALRQKFIAEAGIVLIFFANPQLVSEYGQRGRELYCVQDATLSAAYAWLQAVELDLAVCWVGAFDNELVKKALGIKNDWQPVAILPIGYPGEKPNPTSRRDLADLVHEI